MSQRNSAKDLDSTYVARPPLVDKPIEMTCNSCKNKLNGEQDAKKAHKDSDENAFMKENNGGKRRQNTNPFVSFL